MQESHIRKSAHTQGQELVLQDRRRNVHRLRHLRGWHDRQLFRPADRRHRMGHHHRHRDQVRGNPPRGDLRLLHLLDELHAQERSADADRRYRSVLAQPHGPHVLLLDRCVHRHRRRSRRSLHRSHARRKDHRSVSVRDRRHRRPVLL